MDNFEQNVNAIRMMLSYEIPIAEIHDKMIERGMTEDDFFLVFQAAKIANKED